jgi:tetratricopeptide (TPR) repeat protein
MDMEETKKAWQAYAAFDKSHYKPLFSFDDIATFDRSVYNQISNPLVLRIFLEVYNAKNLKKKKEKRVNIWYNWLSSMTEKEQELMRLLAEEIWERGVNELFLDDLLKKEHIKDFLVSDLVNSPYQRLKNMGWIGRYTKDLNACISFTVEGALFYLIGKMLQQKAENIDTNYVKKLLKEGSRLQRSGLEEFLCEEVLSGNLSLICALIDQGDECIDICIRPLLYSLKTLGVDETLKKILENKTENDWKALLKLEELLGKLQLQILRKEFFIKLVNYLDYENLDEIKLGLKAIAMLDDEFAKLEFQQINVSLVLNSDRADLLSALAKCEERFSNYNKALEYHEKSLEIRKKTVGENHLDVASSYNSIAFLWHSKGDFDLALEYSEKSLEIKLETIGDNHTAVAISFNNIGIIWNSKGNNVKALEYFNKSLEIIIKKVGENHSDVAASYNNIGVIWKSKRKYSKAIEFCEISLKIRLKIFGESHPDVASSYSNLGGILKSKGDYDKALEYYEKSLYIRLKTLGKNHPNVAKSFGNIGNVWKSKGNYDKALEYFLKCLDIRLQTLGAEHPDVALSYFNIAQCLESLGRKDEALNYFMESAEIRKKSIGLEKESTKDAIQNAKRLATELGKENELPDWMREL